ncbi:MAG: tetratricopeptide (TPR) repeat protein/DNA-binding beta-propeller fold protein YncE [Gammaproteobacteria bacterium]|jgi:tetratricopeptide (TPR) repeat protein/DNA-binding beta-propeller fold protein YncE
MSMLGRNLWVCLIFVFAWQAQPALALEMLHLIDGKEHASFFSEGKGLKITNDGIVYVTSEKKGSLLKITNGITEILPLTPSVFKDSDLGGIDTLSNGNLVIVNRGSDRVAVTTPDLTPVLLFSKSGSDPGELDAPRTVVASVNNRIYVADRDNEQITVFNDQGLFLRSFARDGSGGKDIQKPTHISIDAKENIYVLEGQDRFSVYDLQGNLIERFKTKHLKDQFEGIPKFVAMTADLSGNLYLADQVTSQITIFDWRKKEVIQRFGALGQSRAQYRHITQLSVNSRGQIAILDTKNKKVEVFQLDQTEFESPVIDDTVRFGDQLDVKCKAVQTLADSTSLCVKRDKKGTVVLSADGKEIGPFAPEVKKPTSLHSDQKTVAFLEGNKLHAYSIDGKNLFSIGRYGIAAGGFQDPKNVFIAHGQYYVSDSGNNRVQVFSHDGQFVEEVKAGSGSDKLFGKVGPIAVDSKQNLYIGDKDGSGLIRVINKERNLVTSIGMKSSSIHKLETVRALDVDKQDRLYVLSSTDFNPYQIQIFKDFIPYRTFGAGDANGTGFHFEEISSMSVASSDTNSIHLNDIERNKLFRYDLLEYPDAAFGLKIAANKKEVNFEWSSSRSPLIKEYEIQAASDPDGPYKKINSTDQLTGKIPVSQAGQSDWFRVVSVSGYGLRANPSAPKENQFQQIATLHKAKKYADVIKPANKLLKTAPDNADAMDILASSLFHLKDYASAIGVYKQLEAFAPYKNEAIKYQVQAYFELEQYLEAQGLIDEVLETSPAEVEPYLICTQLSLKLADAIGAVTCAEDGLELHQDNIELRYLLGRAYIEAGLVDEGLEAYQTLVESNPADYQTRLKIAGDLYNLQRFDEALGHFDSIVSAQPALGAASVGKARSLLSLNRDDEAKAIAVKLSGKKTTKGEGYYLLGKIAAKQGNHKEAVLRLTRAGKDKPDEVDAWLSLAQSYVSLNQLPKAIKSLNRGIKHNAEAFELYHLGGKIELERQRFPEANAMLDKAVELNPKSLAVQKLYARGLFTTRNYRSAATHADIAARIAPQDIDVLTLQADIAGQQGKIGTAIEYLKTAINQNPASAELQYQIGRVYQDANLFDPSREHLEKAASINPAWAVPHVALGDLFSKRRLFDEAIGEYEKAIALDPSAKNRAILNVAFSDRKKSLEFKNNAPQLLLSDLNLQTVFSSAYKKYLDQPIGSVMLKNVSATDYGNLKLSFQIKEFMDFPATVEIPSVKGNETQKIDIKATFNNRILEVDEDTGVQVEVKLTYMRDGQKDDITLTQPMTIYGKNALVWGDPAMIGSFVTPKDDTLRDYVRQVVNKFQPDAGPLNDKLISAMAFFSSLTASGTSYIIDPNTPFTELRDDQIDYVQFPRETLKLKSGDCDDLSVLISAGLENLGIKTAFVEVPGHLFLMFDTGISSDDSGLISQNGSLLAIKDGNVWIPLEATMVASSFTEAWAEGARKYHKGLAESNLSIIDLSQAWKEYKPVTLRKANYSIALPEPKRTHSLVKQEKAVLLAKSIDRLILPYQTMVMSNPQNIAARLQIAILYARFGLFEYAEIAFDALNELAPKDSAVQTNQGNLYFLQEDYKQAIENYTQASILDDKDGGIFINLSMAYYKAGNMKQANSSYKTATQLKPALKQEYLAYSKLLSQ